MENKSSGTYTDTILSDFKDPIFQSAFQEYFAELGIAVKDWNGLFQEMCEEDGNTAIVRETGEGITVGFILYKPIDFTNWFFEETRGFIREFWIRKEYRNAGHGSALLGLAEEALRRQGIHTFILTTDTAQNFYIKHGYKKDPACKAKNKDEVFVKTEYCV